MERGGRFVVSVAVPRPQDFTPGGKGRVFALNRDHVGIETLDDPVGQVAWFPSLDDGRRASSTHGCLAPSTPRTNSRATRARSATPASVTLFRTTSPAADAPRPFPATQPRNCPARPAHRHGRSTPTHASSRSPPLGGTGLRAPAQENGPSVRQIVLSIYSPVTRPRRQRSAPRTSDPTSGRCPPLQPSPRADCECYLPSIIGLTIAFMSAATPSRSSAWRICLRCHSNRLSRPGFLGGRSFWESWGSWFQGSSTPPSCGNVRWRWSSSCVPSREAPEAPWQASVISSA